MDSASTSNWATLATVVAGFLYQIFREGRNRRWDLEDRRLLAERVANSAVEVASHQKKMGKAIEENIVLTKAATEAASLAYHEANSVNLKIANLGAESNKLQKEFNEEVKK